MSQSIKNICVKIAKQTDENDHTGAKITIAKLCGFRDFVQVFEAIEKLHNIEGSLPTELSDYRMRKGVEMMERVKAYFPETFYEQINKSL
jgi:hypothetical protein